MLTPQELAREIAAGRFKPAYYLYGSEDYRIIEAEKFIARHFLPDRQITTNYRKLNARRTKSDDIIAELSNLPMLGERQVFGITEFQFYRPPQVERILKLLKPPDPNRIVIFSSPSARMPKRNSAFYKAISRAMEVVGCNKLTPAETSALIRKRLKDANIEIDREALQLLMELTAGSMGAVEAELAKLTNYKQPGESITIEDIRSVAAGYEVYSIFELAEHIVNDRAGHVLQMLENLIGQGNSPVALCSLLVTHFLSLYLIKNNKPLLPRLSFLANKYRQQASRYDNLRLEQILKELAATDADLRGKTALTPQMALEVLVVSLLRKK